ncbi:MAG: exodeoxyribonuclease VII large subunit, partial [Acidimicrobiales bacterium]
MAPGVDDMLAASPVEAAGVLTIADLYGEVEGALATVFPRSRQLWVRGEIQSVADQHGRTGHCYLDLVDPETAGERQAPVLRVKCWRSTWGPLRGTLAREGIELRQGMVVVLRGTLDFYRPRAEVGFILAELDVTALLGRLAAERAALLRSLAAEGLLERNRSLRVPAVPLRVGLVASPGTEGYRDFLGQLIGSGYGFSVTVAPTQVQGADAPVQVAGALATLSAGGPERYDLLVVVRGGGSKADLATFDAEPVARAVATSTVPVWTGIGHTGDESVADLVANRSCITPTECGRELAGRVDLWWESSVAVPAAVVARRAGEAVAAAERRAHDARARVAGTARHLAHRQAERLAT